MATAREIDILDFAAVLDVNLYSWQARICLTVSAAAALRKRKKITVRAPNGVGKTQRIIALCALWHLHKFPKGKVIITSKDEKQIAVQLWPALTEHRSKFPNWKFTQSPHRIVTPQGGQLVAFTTDDEHRAEGYHSGPDAPLLMIIDEAKSVAREIFEAFDRCGYDCLLYISSPWLKEGCFYESFTSNGESFIPFHVKLPDCPHIDPEKIRDIIERYGENDPYTRSNLYGEFMDEDGSTRHVFELPDIEANRANTIDHVPGPLMAGCDFAQGGDENVLCVRNGNRIKEPMICWRERDTMSAIGRFVIEFKRLGLEPSQIWADGTGAGIPMCDALAQAGWSVNRFNFGGHSSDQRYKNLGSYCWHEVAAKVRTHQITVPDDATLRAQLTSRRTKYDSMGKLWMEQKNEMASRGVKSPDRADAFCIAFGVQPVASASWIQSDANNHYAEISASHGWAYQNDRESNHDTGLRQTLEDFGISNW